MPRVLFFFFFFSLCFSNLCYHVELVHEIPLAVMETPSLFVNLKHFPSSGHHSFPFSFGILQSWSSMINVCHVKLVSDQQPGDLLHTSTRTVSQYVSGSVSLCFEPSGAILVTLVVLCMQGPLIYNTLLVWSYYVQ